MKNPRGPQQIVIAGRKAKWDRATIGYEKTVTEWNKLDPSRTVEGQPRIDWKNRTFGR